MIDVRMLVGTEEAENGFYPTPAHLVRRMLDAVDWSKVDSVLEPSAGKGDLAIPAAQRVISRSRSYDRKDLSSVDLDCIEIDPNLRAILKDKGLRVVHDDFLTYSTMKRYSLIVMNPPFDNAARHILKAISLLKPEGQLVALCNAETLRNPWTNERNLLVRMLGNAKIDYLAGEFLGGERKTDVETAMITYIAPAADLEDSLILERLRPAHKYVDMTPEQTAALTKADFVDAIIDRYNYEVESGVRLIREYKAVRSILSSGIRFSDLELNIGKEDASENNWVRNVRHKYWEMLFAAPQFVKQLTTNLQQDLYNKVTELENYEFSYFNIKEIMIQMNAHMTEGVESTIMKLFDDWTRKYHWDENAPNRHYFDGWRTNDAFAVNRKAIVPLRAYTDWGSRIEPEFRVYNVINRLQDIERVFNYLDGGRTLDSESLNEILSRCEKTGETRKVDTKYFYITFYKKGTAHLEFKDMDLLAKFNIFAARGKNWLPPTFGRKKYREMNTEEKRTVDSFMGGNAEKKYNTICEKADYFLQTGSDMIALPA